MTSDGMLSCYTPFLLAIARARIAGAASTRKESPPSGSSPEVGTRGAVSPPGSCGGAGGDMRGRSDDSNPSGGGGVLDCDAHTGGDGSGGGSKEDGETRNSTAGPFDGPAGKGGSDSSGKNGGEGGRPTDEAKSAATFSGVDSCCPPRLCAETLWALSEYAVLSPGLAAAEVLPLAEVLAMDTLEHAEVCLSRPRKLRKRP